MAAALLLGCSPVWSTTPASFDDSEIVSTQEPDWFKQSFLDLGEDLAEARAAGKQGLMIVFHSEACAY